MISQLVLFLSPILLLIFFSKIINKHIFLETMKVHTKRILDFIVQIIQFIKARFYFIQFLG